MVSLLDYDFGNIAKVNKVLLIGIGMIAGYIAIAYFDNNAATGALVWLVVIGGLCVWFGARRQKTGHYNI